MPWMPNYILNHPVVKFINSRREQKAIGPDRNSRNPEPFNKPIAIRCTCPFRDELRQFFGAVWIVDQTADLENLRNAAIDRVEIAQVDLLARGDKQ